MCKARPRRPRCKGPSSMIMRQEIEAALDERLENLRALTPSDINDLLIRLMGIASKTYCANLFAGGATREQVNEKLIAYIPELDLWRAMTLAKIMRRFNEPRAPSHTIQ